MIRRSVLPCLVLILAICGAASAQPPDLDQWVARAMQTFEVPGIGLTIVKGDAPLAKGLRRAQARAPPRGRPDALRDRLQHEGVHRDGARAAVEEHKIEWDAPVVRCLPGFAMWDPFVTRELTVRDLLVHRSGFGLGAGDLLWWPESTYSRKEIARRLRFIPPATSFRSAYAYDNVLYLIAGELIETISGQTWEDFISARILAKVGMSGSYPRYSAAAASGRVATPHARIDGKVRPIAPFGSDNTNPAGGIYSSPEDMAKWLRVQLSGGKLADGSRLFSDATSRQLTAIVTPIPIGADPPGEMAALKMNFHGYALGFDVRDYRGRPSCIPAGCPASCRASP
jgi:CubicO group peptidase (beta-lactamase class C family)